MDSIKSRWLTLVTQWVNFLCSFFQPTVVILILLIVFLLYASYQFALQPLVSNTFITIISILSGLVGGMIAKRLAEISEGTILVTRGKSAIRGLKALFNQVSAIENRTSIYINRLDPKNQDYKLVKNNYEEIIGKCVTLQDEVLNSIEDFFLSNENSTTF